MSIIFGRPRWFVVASAFIVLAAGAGAYSKLHLADLLFGPPGPSAPVAPTPTAIATPAPVPPSPTAIATPAPVPPSPTAVATPAPVPPSPSVSPTGQAATPAPTGTPTKLLSQRVFCVPNATLEALLALSAVPANLTPVQSMCVIRLWIRFGKRGEAALALASILRDYPPAQLELGKLYDPNSGYSNPHFDVPSARHYYGKALEEAGDDDTYTRDEARRLLDALPQR